LPHVDVAARGNKYKLYQSYVEYDFRKHFFTNRVASLLNTLPDGVVYSDTINRFKSRLDKLWTNQDVVYNWEADFTGTRNRSLCSLQHFKILLKLTEMKIQT